MAQQLIGYEEDGSPRYEIVLDGQPTLLPGEEPLPPMNSGMTLDQLDAMSQVSGIDMQRDDLAAASGEVPQQVADDVAQSSPEVRRAEPALQNEGSYFDLSYIEQMRNAYQQALQQSGGDQQKAAAMVKPVWNSFTPVQKHVYQQAEGFASLDPKFAAGIAVKYHEEQKRMQEQQSDPVKVAQVTELNSKIKDAQTKKQMALDEIASTRSMINDMLSHPGFSGSVGAKNSSYLFGLKQEPIAGTAEADFYPYIQQIKGGAFLKAFERIRGGGSISEIEGEKATDAIIRSQTSQSEEGFKKSMNDFLSIINGVEKRMNDSAGKALQQQAPASTGGSTPSMPQTDTRKRTTLMGTKYAVNPDGTLEKVSQ
jgi:hypothetical protein